MNQVNLQHRSWIRLQFDAYWYVFRTAFRHKLAARLDLVSRIVLYLIIMTVFTQIWLATADAAAVWREQVWYLMATEWVVLAIPYVHLDIESEIRAGEAPYAQLLPVSWAGLHFARAMGASCALWMVLGGAGVIMTWVLTGGIWGEPMNILPVAGLTIVALTIGTAAHVGIGLLAWWTGDATPVAWVWQKLMFVLGGLILPLAIYPDWLQDIARWTPFHSMVGAAGEMLTMRGPLEAAVVLGHYSKLVGWAFVIGAAVLLANHYAVKRLRKFG